MARPIRVEVPGGLYHVVVRGNERKNVFRDDADRVRYLERLALYRERFAFHLLAYCLMDNHVHLANENGVSPEILISGTERSDDGVDRLFRPLVPVESLLEDGNGFEQIGLFPSEVPCHPPEWDASKLLADVARQAPRVRDRSASGSASQRFDGDAGHVCYGS